MMSSKVEIVKCRAFIGTSFGQNLAMKVFDIDEKALEKLVWRYKSGKHIGSLRGKITWWQVEKAGYDPEHKIAITEKKHSFGYRIVDYNEEKVYLGSFIRNGWYEDYVEYKDSLITNEERTLIQQEKYRQQKIERSKKMIDTFFKGTTDPSLVEKFSIGLKTSEKEVKEYFMKLLFVFSFMSGRHDLVDKIKNTFGTLSVEESDDTTTAHILVTQEQI